MSSPLLNSSSTVLIFRLNSGCESLVWLRVASDKLNRGCRATLMRNETKQAAAGATVAQAAAQIRSLLPGLALLTWCRDGRSKLAAAAVGIASPRQATKEGKDREKEKARDGGRKRKEKAAASVRTLLPAFRLTCLLAYPATNPITASHR
ncbi:hypothetical protein BC567DRAFT_216672 [Phyllosticta citribraziliensis]